MKRAGKIIAFVVASLLVAVLIAVCLNGRVGLGEFLYGFFMIRFYGWFGYLPFVALYHWPSTRCCSWQADVGRGVVLATGLLGLGIVPQLVFGGSDADDILLSIGLAGAGGVYGGLYHQ
ncbi:hypothetical protein GCM10011375_38000 [Hymenobacter qilianensis]|uniref:Uncharacterized protein n=1 Tax=Hymenobacter qilianensis TaxID=1385715 RepID=A0ACB5PWT2_9BACT|nr:hypothetical protein GCM10011375_38000 [Hymenobacter qilianensis]